MNECNLDSYDLRGGHSKKGAGAMLIIDEWWIVFFDVGF